MRSKKSLCVNSHHFSKIVLFVLIAFSISFSYVYADVDSMKTFFPTLEHISPQWMMSDFKAQSNVDIEDSNETANVIAKAFVIEDQEGSDSTMRVNLNLFEFESIKVSEQMQKRISEKVLTIQEDSHMLQIDGFENCLGYVTDLNAENEESFMSCIEGRFVVISNAVQDGFVYEGGNQLKTPRTSSAFATFVINQLPDDPVIPQWVKNNAGWWADGTIDDASFISGIEFLIENGILSIE